MRPELSPDAHPERFVSQFAGYSEPERDDTAVVLCHFSPAGFRRPAENARRVVSDMREAGIPVYPIELVQGGRRQEIVNPHLVVEADSVMFHKENLLNLALDSLPSRHSKAVFLDADVRFSDRNWLDRVSHVLDSADVIQPMEWCFWSSTRSKISAAEQLSRGRRLNVGNVHPGFATAARRDWLDRVGGLYDLAVVGNGDACLWHAVGSSMGLGFQGESLAPYLSKYKGYDEYVEKVKASSPRVASMRGCFAGHLPHGTANNRRYVERHKMLVGDLSVRRNASGVYEWEDPSNNGPMLEYFRSRDEDNLTTQDSLEPHMDVETLDLFRNLLSQAKTYIEYGCGGSTSFAFLNSATRIVGVETDRSWMEMVMNFMPGRLERVDLCHVDLGEVGEWGFPKSEADGTVYASWPWTRAEGADLVLVDGRFRVACTLKSMLEARPGTPVIFEDYFGRDFYSAIERLAKPQSRHGRSALFVVPQSIDRNLAELILKRHVRDAR
jgi:hypothetical protein